MIGIPARSLKISVRAFHSKIAEVNGFPPPLFQGFFDLNARDGAYQVSNVNKIGKKIIISKYPLFQGGRTGYHHITLPEKNVKPKIKIMKKIIHYLFIISLGMLVHSYNVQAQLLDKLGSKAKQQLDKTVDKGIDKTVNNTKEKQSKAEKDTPSSNAEVSGDQTTESASADSEKKVDYVSSYKSKFDFVPGEKVILTEDFSQDAVGDFPALWFTNGSGEVVTIEGREGKWLMLNEYSMAFVDMLLDLPDNFTIQFDLLCSVPFSWFSGVFNLYMDDIIDIDRYKEGDNGGEMSSNNINHHFWIDFHPGKYNPGTYTTEGYGNYQIKNQGERLNLKEIWMPGPEKDLAKISIWRQGQRLRVYMNENKILDLPKVLPADMKPNLIVFEPHDLEDEDKYFIGNLRLAVGNPDTRNKLLTDGKLVTNGILFAVNSAQIKTESYGVLKEIAGILNEDKSIKVKIVGHTDSDGDDAMNLELSKKRAEAVKNALVKDFGIDAGRLETDGKGEQEPLAPNTDAIAKANNRRVEFLKTN